MKLDRRRRSPRPVAEALQTVVGQVEPETLLAAVQTVWADAVGEAIAAEASPVAERDGVVAVACRSATWANELDLLGDQILAQVRKKLPSGAALGGFRFNATQARD